MNQTSLRSGYGFAAGTVLIWSGFVLMARIGGKSPLTAFDTTALRFGVASLVLFPLWVFWKRVPLFDRRMLALAATGGLGYSLTIYWAFKFAPAAHGAVLVSGLLPFFVPLCAYLMLKEPFRHSLRLALPVIGLGLGFLAVDVFGQGGNTWFGDMLLVTSSLLWAVYTLLVRRFGFDPWETAIGGVLLSALLYLPVYALFLPKQIMVTPLHMVMAQGFYHGVVVVIVAMLLYMQAMVRLGPIRLGSVMALVPAVAGLGSSLVLGEPLSVWLVLGLVLTSFGAYLGTR